MTPREPSSRLLRWIRYAFWLLIPLLLWWAFHSLQWGEILAAMRRLAPWQVVVFVGTNLLLVGLFGTRWRTFVGGTCAALRVPELAGYWLAGFGIDYLTPAPGIGGEPVLVSLLHDRHDLSPPTAAAAVGLDRLVDTTTNFAVLSTSALLILHWQVFHHHIVARTIALPLGLLLILGVATASFLRGRLPIHWLARHLPIAIRRSELMSFLRRSEVQASNMLQGQRGRIYLAFALSFLIWAGILVEYWLLLFFLDFPLTLPQLVTAVTAHRLSFLLPLPAGLGAFEASQVFAFRTLGLDPALAVSAAIIIRARDLLFAVLGLAWGSWQSGGWRRLRSYLGGDWKPENQPS